MKIQAPDLSKEFPRSPYDTSIAGYVIAARALDKCRASIAGTLGEYHSGCPLDNLWLEFVGLSFEAFRDLVATGASDEQVSAWIIANAKTRPRSEIIKWNNSLRCMRISEMPLPLQEFLESYIPKTIPPNRRVHFWFDLYDIEENRI
jgi:hypothetical protein